MERIKKVFSNYRVPGFRKLWNSQRVAAVDKSPPLFIQLEAALVFFQELALWGDPFRSLMALATINGVYIYLYLTSNTVINLCAWSFLTVFLYRTWIYRVWPEIRVPPKHCEDAQSFTPIHPSVISGPEMQRMYERICAFSQETVERRRNHRALFSILEFAGFLTLAYLGTVVSTLGLLYAVFTGSLVLPVLFFRLSKAGFNFTIPKPRVSEEEENAYLPNVSDVTDGSGILEEPFNEKTFSDIFKESPDAANSFVTGLANIPSYDEDDGHGSGDEFIPSIHKGDSRHEPKQLLDHDIEYEDLEDDNGFEIITNDDVHDSL